MNELKRVVMLDEWLTELREALRKRHACGPVGQYFWRNYIRFCLRHIRRLKNEPADS